MKILLTGALGHIGSFVARQLPFKFANSSIILVDNLLTQRYTSLFHLPKLGNYTFHEADISKIDLIHLLRDVDVVIHLAAITDAAGSFDRAAELEENNYNATLKVAEACLATDTRMISLSSTSVYGTQNSIVSEDCTPDELKPQSPYAKTKLKEEDLLIKMNQQTGLKVCICRFGTIYGVSPGMRFHTAVNKFCWQASMDLPITVWSTAFNQKRPYLDLIDASRAFVHIINSDLFQGKVYNVLTQNSTVKEITDVIKTFIPSLKIEFVDNQIMNQLSYEVSSERFTKTGFNYNGDLELAIGNTINWLK